MGYYSRQKSGINKVFMISANFATHKARRDVIDRAVNSIKDQVDVVRVYYNDYNPPKRDWEQYTGKDITDKGKFAHIKQGEIVFTCDDDLLYPCDYVSKTLQRFYEHEKKIVTYHGRKLRGKGLNYYRGHQSFHFMHTTLHDEIVDVPGTGVMAFDTREFMPDILKYDQDKMVDLLFALEARKKRKKIVCLRHVRGWIKTLTDKESIYAEMVNNCAEQNQLADELLSI